MRVLLSNDDGINAPGLRALYFALKRAGHEVVAVAPSRQQSGVGHSLTVFEPLRATPVRDGKFEGIGVNGTPTDCVKLGLGCLAPWRPDLVMAGINLGQNVGPDIFYSGTIGAAAEAAHDNVPSMAISHAAHDGSRNLDKAADHAVALASCLDWNALPPRRVINVNYPNREIGDCAGVRVCHQSPAVWKNVYEQRRDPAGLPYWWLNGDMDAASIGAESDRGLLSRGFVTITPLRFEYTDHDALPILEKMGVEKLKF